MGALNDEIDKINEIREADGRKTKPKITLIDWNVYHASRRSIRSQAVPKSVSSNQICFSFATQPNRGQSVSKFIIRFQLNSRQLPLLPLWTSYSVNVQGVSKNIIWFDKTNFSSFAQFRLIHSSWESEKRRFAKCLMEILCLFIYLKYLGFLFIGIKCRIFPRN